MCISCIGGYNNPFGHVVNNTFLGYNYGYPYMNSPFEGTGVLTGLSPYYVTQSSPPFAENLRNSNSIFQQTHNEVFGTYNNYNFNNQMLFPSYSSNNIFGALNNFDLNNSQQYSYNGVFNNNTDIEPIKDSVIDVSPKTEASTKTQSTTSTLATNPIHHSASPSHTELYHGVKYNSKKGESLAKNVLAGLPQKREKALCARFVKNAVVKSGLGPYIDGNGEYCKYIFRANDNFKQISAKGLDFSTLPKGAIVTYDAGTRVSNSQKTWNIGEDGHVLISLGNGKGCSDIIDEEIPRSDRAYVFIPV